jgi:hypothetical protein
MSRPPLSKKKRQEIWDADKIPGLNAARCRYCGGIIKAGEPWDASHEEPYSSKLWLILPKRFREAKWNYGVAHPHCNRSAGAAPMTVWQSLSLVTKLKLAAVAVMAALIVIAYLVLK